MSWILVETFFANLDLRDGGLRSGESPLLLAFNFRERLGQEGAAVEGCEY